ncbi:MAG TPA: large-conductance mechanosensitive channel protein MscL [Gemmatimonadota bacterium]|nr:large-conductance mechanosensitive channel protein MscL [Gemmatimonadota bacterium]
MWKEFKEFAMRGNVLDMAIGFIIGGAFTPIAKSLVDDVIMPPIGLLIGDMEFTDLFMVLKQGALPGPYATLGAAQEAGAVTLNYGLFVNTVVTFLIVAFAVFLMVKAINRMRRREEGASSEEPTTKTCPYCLSTIPLKAGRCAFCTVELAASS